MEKSFQIGDKVVVSDRYIKYYITGVIEKISDKRGNITIKCDKGKGEKKFNSDGHNLYEGIYIELLTPEIQQFIDNRELVYHCRNTFIRAYDNNKLTPDRAKRIMEILKDEKD